jgi:hypothetical protein
MAANIATVYVLLLRLLSVEIDADFIIKLPTCQGRFNVKRRGQSLLEEWDGKAQSGVAEEIKALEKSGAFFLLTPSRNLSCE